MRSRDCLVPAEHCPSLDDWSGTYMSNTRVAQLRQTLNFDNTYLKNNAWELLRQATT